MKEGATLRIGILKNQQQASGEGLTLGSGG